MYYKILERDPRNGQLYSPNLVAGYRQLFRQGETTRRRRGWGPLSAWASALESLEYLKYYLTEPGGKLDPNYRTWSCNGTESKDEVLWCPNKALGRRKRGRTTTTPIVGSVLCDDLTPFCEVTSAVLAQFGGILK